MRVEIEVPEERIQDLLCNAFEGGSNYWYVIEEYHYPNRCRLCGKVTLNESCFRCKEPTVVATKKTLNIQCLHSELPFKGGWLTIGDIEDSNGEKNNLTLEAIRRGVRIMANRYPNHFADFISENDDAVTGDIFLQCSLFGEVIYG